MHIFLVFLICLLPLQANDTIHIRSQQSPADVSHNYYWSLLKLVAEKTEEIYGKTEIVTTTNMSQKRAFTELRMGKIIDVEWAGTNIERENEFIPIRIPLNGGLLGYRVPAIRAEDTLKFKRIEHLNDLKKFRAVQGSHWPDSDILEYSGLPITRVALFSSMYPMLKAKRIDYFPRGINEIYGEVEAFGENIIPYDSLMIVYKFPMYFFVNRENFYLAKRIEKGLRKAIADGSFRKHMETHPATSYLFPLSKYKDARFIEIENPFLPPETPVDDSTLWIIMKDEK